MSVRVVVLAGVVHAPLVRTLLVPFAAMTAATLVPVALLLQRKGDGGGQEARLVELRNPFSLTSAVKFGLLFAAVLLVVAGVRRYFPGQGYYVVAALAGLTDVDAITPLDGLARPRRRHRRRRPPPARSSSPRSPTRSSSAGSSSAPPPSRCAGGWSW